jgi:hypothetical protein
MIVYITFGCRNIVVSLLSYPMRLYPSPFSVRFLQ